MFVYMHTHTQYNIHYLFLVWVGRGRVVGPTGIAGLSRGPAALPG